ncbi:hypothetical protein F5882DRAFT_387531 [Hyaloscypha sp. PMI_1271]|nr:hypothetical protein F5882DRAFT_387531 [Hyaloscypha sp. PMI_1271]
MNIKAYYYNTEEYRDENKFKEEIKEKVKYKISPKGSSIAYVLLLKDPLSYEFIRSKGDKNNPGKEDKEGRKILVIKIEEKENKKNSLKEEADKENRKNLVIKIEEKDNEKTLEEIVMRVLSRYRRGRKRRRKIYRRRVRGKEVKIIREVYLNRGGVKFVLILFLISTSLLRIISRENKNFIYNLYLFTISNKPKLLVNLERDNENYITSPKY